MNKEQFLEEFKKKTKEEISKLNYRKYFYQFSSEEQTELIKELKSIEIFFKEEFEIELYPVYGTLLGMIRDKDIIQWDTDFDMAYLSNYRNKKAVLKEYEMICRFLEEKGLMVKKMKTASHLHIFSPSKRLKIDLWISWIDLDYNYHLVWSVNGDIDASMILPFNNIEFKGQTFKLINDPIRFFDEHYKNWNSEYIDGYQENWAKRKPRFELEAWKGE